MQLAEERRQSIIEADASAGAMARLRRAHPGLDLRIAVKAAPGGRT
jgi:hypothetical protein